MQSPHAITHFPGAELLEALCNSLQEGTAVIEKSSAHVVFCNKAWLEMFGVATCDEINMTALGYMRKAKLPNAGMQHFIAIAEHDDIYKEEVEFLTSGGLPFWGEMSIRALNSGDHVYYLV